MFWTAVASSTLSSSSTEPSSALASAAPNYHQLHTKPPLRSLNNSWQISNAAFKTRLHHQQQEQREHKEQKQQQQEQMQMQKKQQQQDQQRQRELKQQQQQEAQIDSDQDTAGEEKEEQGSVAKKKIAPKSESARKIFKALTSSCKCTKK